MRRRGSGFQVTNTFRIFTGCSVWCSGPPDWAVGWCESRLLHSDDDEMRMGF